MFLQIIKLNRNLFITLPIFYIKYKNASSLRYGAIQYNLVQYQTFASLLEYITLSLHILWTYAKVIFRLNLVTIHTKGYNTCTMNK